MGSTLVVGQTDNFNVVATSLNRHLDYALSVLADQETGLRRTSEEDEPLAFDSASSDCDVKIRRTNIPRNSRSYTWNPTLVGCEAGTGELSAYLLDRTGFSNPAFYEDVDDFETETGVVAPPPPPPQNLDAAEDGTSRVDLSWDSVSGNRWHLIEQRTGINGSCFEVTSDLSGSTSSHTVTGLSPDTTYYFRVSAYGNGSNYLAQWSDPSDVDWATTDPLPYPPAPTGLRVTFADSNSVSLAWDSLSGTGEYRAQYRVRGTRTWTESDETDENDITLVCLMAGHSYEFQVQAIGDGRTYREEGGDWSDSVFGSTPTMTITGLEDNAVPLAGEVTFTVKLKSLNSNLQYALSAIADQETGFRGRSQTDEEENRNPSVAFGRGTDECGTKITRATVPRFSTTHDWDVTLVGCEIATSELTIFLFDRTGHSNVSDYKEVTWIERTIRVIAAAPDKVDDPDLFPLDQSLEVDWDAPDDGGSPITHYHILWKLASEDDDEWSAPIRDTNREHKLTGLDNGTEYDVQVRACNIPGGCGDWSDNGTEYDVQVRACNIPGGCGNWSDTASETPENQPPDVFGPSTPNVRENTSTDTGVGTYTARDPEGTSVSWRLGGIDRDDLTITNGVLTFGEIPDFENPRDHGRNNDYRITVIATDRGSETAEGERDVIIQVTDVNERPVVETVLSNTTLVVDDDPTEIPHLGTFSDPDGDTLYFAVTSSDTSVVSLGITDDDMLEMTPMSQGPSTITVSVADRETGGLTTTQSFTATVTLATTLTISMNELEKGATAPITSIGGQPATCPDYTGIFQTVYADVEAAVNAALSLDVPLTEDTLKMLVRSVLDRFEKAKLISLEDPNHMRSEVEVLDNAPYEPSPANAFQELSKQVGLGYCHPACALATEITGASEDRRAVDIIISSQSIKGHFPSPLTANNFPGSDTVSSKGDVQFNSCDNTVKTYSHLVHELGHALGIGGGNTGKDSVEKAHPNRTIIDITMAYDAVHDCSPQPLDVMAIYALYQTVDSR